MNSRMWWKVLNNIVIAHVSHFTVYNVFHTAVPSFGSLGVGGNGQMAGVLTGRIKYRDNPEEHWKSIFILGFRGVDEQ